MKFAFRFRPARVRGCGRTVLRLVRDVIRFLWFGATAAALAPAAARAGDVYVFGDSGADMGNYFALPGNAPAQGSPYFRGPDGLYRLSDGPMWPELQFPGMRSGSDPTIADSSVNFAYGAAKSDAGSFSGDPGETLPIGLQSQLDSFEARLASGKLTVGRETIAILYAGTNDLFEALALGSDVLAKSDDVTTNLETAVARLASHGVTTIYVSEIVDIGEAAAFYNTGLAADQEAALRATLNAVGAAARERMRAGLATAVASAGGKVNVVVLPLNKLFAAVRANPAAFGFTHMHEAIYDDANGKLLVADAATQKGYFFLDSLHTTARAQRLEGLYYRAVIDAIDGTAQRRLARTVDGAISAIDTVDRALIAPVASQSLRPSGSRKWQVFLHTPFSHDRVAGADGEETATFETTAGILSLRWPESRAPALTVAVGYVGQDGEVGDRGLRFKARGGVGAVTNERVVGPVMLRSEVSHGRFDLKTARAPELAVINSVMVARSDTEIMVDRGSLAGSHVFAFDKWSLRLEGGLTYTKVSVDRFSESDAPGLDLDVAEVEHESLRGSVEVRAQAKELGARWLRVRPELSLRLNHEFADAGVEVAAQLIDNTSPRVIGTSSHGNRSHFDLAPCLALPIKQHAVATISYRYETDGRNFQRHGLWINLCQRF